MDEMMFAIIMMTACLGVLIGYAVNDWFNRKEIGIWSTRYNNKARECYELYGRIIAADEKIEKLTRTYKRDEKGRFIK